MVTSAFLDIPCDPGRARTLRYGGARDAARAPHCADTDGPRWLRAGTSIAPATQPDCRCRPAALAYLQKQRLTRTGKIYASQEAGHDSKDNIFREDTAYAGAHVGKMKADELWHRRLMHMSYGKLKRASTMNLQQSQMCPSSSGCCGAACSHLDTLDLYVLHVLNLSL